MQCPVHGVAEKIQKQNRVSEMDPKPKLSRRPVQRRSCEDEVGYECESRSEQSVEHDDDRHQRIIADPAARKRRLILIFGNYEF